MLQHMVHDFAMMLWFLWSWKHQNEKLWEGVEKHTRVSEIVKDAMNRENERIFSLSNL